MQGVSALPNRSNPFRPVIDYDHFAGSSITLFPSPFTLNGLVRFTLFGATLLLGLHPQVSLRLFVFSRIHPFAVVEGYTILVR